jgi:hypothetical protein
MAVGAGAAGVAVAATQVPLALALDIATFAVGAALFARVRVALLPARARAERARESGFRYLRGKPRILLLVLSFSVATFATGLTNATLPRLLGGIPGFDSGSYGFGIAVLAGGLAVGEIAVGFSRIGSTAGRWIGAGLLLASALLGLLALSNHAPSALLALALLGFVDGSTDILYDLVIQREIDPRYYGAVFGLSSASMAATMVGAIALAPVLGDFMSGRAVVIVGSAGFAAGGIVALAAMASPGRRALRRRPDPALAASSS